MAKEIISKFRYDSEVDPFVSQFIENKDQPELIEIVRGLLNFRKKMLLTSHKKSSKTFERRREDPEFRAMRREYMRNYRARQNT